MILLPYNIYEITTGNTIAIFYAGLEWPPLFTKINLTVPAPLLNHPNQIVFSKYLLEKDLVDNINIKLQDYLNYLNNNNYEYTARLIQSN